MKHSCQKFITTAARLHWKLCERERNTHTNRKHSHHGCRSEPFSRLAGYVDAVGVGCRLWRLISSWLWNNWNEVAEMMAVGGWFQSLMVLEGVKQNRMNGALLV